MAESSVELLQIKQRFPGCASGPAVYLHHQGKNYPADLAYAAGCCVVFASVNASDGSIGVSDLYNFDAPVSTLSWSPPRTFLAVVVGCAIHIVTGKLDNSKRFFWYCTASLRLCAQGTALSWTEDGRHLACADDSGRVSLWSVSEGTDVLISKSWEVSFPQSQAFVAAGASIECALASCAAASSTVNLLAPPLEASNTCAPRVVPLEQLATVESLQWRPLGGGCLKRSRATLLVVTSEGLIRLWVQQEGSPACHEHTGEMLVGLKDTAGFSQALVSHNASPCLWTLGGVHNPP
ncbi:hypothetical protein CYMTET_30491 [Cymbomonas tetramitiformis]|uniref:Uncharacterized protein n=1 Tax=Cymbomonas tetramitiformis TaxID=36881 RepID=A0AAE0FK97_9CHLO|nr:hypothetical protein CYMTET_30491 [Cymbomonas tetramitiformis]